MDIAPDAARAELPVRRLDRSSPRGGWTVVDATGKAIEETAAEIIAVLPQ